MHPLARSLALLTFTAACVPELPPAPPPAPPPPAPLRAPDWSPPAREADPHTIDVGLAPALDGPEIGWIAVSLRFSEPPGEFAEPGPLVLGMRLRDAGEGAAESVEELAARDAEGPLPLRAKAADAGEPRVEWRSDRRPVGAVALTYRVKAGRGDAIAGVRAIAGGVAASGGALLALPETADTYRVRLTWDLSKAGARALSVTSLGGGDVDVRTGIERLRSAALLAGPLGRVSVATGPLAADRFEGAWLGKLGFDPVEALPWAARARVEARSLFGGVEGHAFTLLVRAGKGAAWAGADRAGGALVIAGDEQRFTASTRFALARAVVRRWIGGADQGLRLDEPEAKGAWLTQGFAAFYAREVLLRAGLCSIDEAAEEIRERVERLAIGEDTARLAEDRGALYAADLDAAVRAKSGGKRSLDDLMRALLAKAKVADREDGATAPLAAGAFREAVAAELGAEGAARYDAVIARGEAFTVAEGAFGACFKAVKKQVAKGKARVPVTVWARDPKAAASTCARR